MINWNQVRMAMTTRGHQTSSRVSSMTLTGYPALRQALGSDYQVAVAERAEGVVIALRRL